MGYPNTRVTDRGALGELQKHTEDTLFECIRILKASVNGIKRTIKTSEVDEDISDDIEAELGNIGDVVDDLESLKDIFY